MEKIDEVARREKLAIATIKQTLGTEGGEYGADLFVSHHLEELDGEYWKKYLGTDRPDATQILGILELRSHWGGNETDELKNFDFTLPDGVTDYVLCVSFDEAGEVDEISMESLTLRMTDIVGAQSLSLIRRLPPRLNIHIRCDDAT